MRIPSEETLKKYNLSRYILASSYIILGIFSCFKICVSSEYINIQLVHTFSLMTASFQAFLFTFTLLVLIQPRYVTLKRISIQMGLILSFNVALILSYLELSSIVYSYSYYTASGFYIFLLIYYIFLFRKKYSQCLKQLEDYYNEDEDSRFRWINIYFYLALFIGIMALFYTYIPFAYSFIFIILLIAFYIFFAISFCNYPLTFKYVIVAVSSKNENYDLPVVCEEDEINDSTNTLPLSRKEQELQQAINRWVEEKMFTQENISRDDIAKSLGTDRNSLTSFFFHHMKIEFRVWRTQLRIQEAQCILLEYPNMSISQVGQKVGMYDRSNFQKKFTELTQMSPKDWRLYKLKKNN